MNTDMSKTIIPKSDQMNYDDFITGPKNITITRVEISDNENEQQPAKVFYQGDNGKPYKPCKSMRRVMVAVWTKESTNYVGKSMTLYGDPKVMWAGKEVGGIRISHMSHIDKPVSVSISLSKGHRAPFTVKPLKVEMAEPPLDEEEPESYEDLYKRAKAQAVEGIDKYAAFFKPLSKVDKKRLFDKGDHDELKKLAEAMEKEPDYGM
jgi:hypothetical protein